MRKILYVSGTRADYGLMRRVLFCIKAHPKLRLEIAATGMHLMPEFGKTIDEITIDKFKINVIRAAYEDDSRESAVRFIAKFMLVFTEKLKSIKPDIILVLGDRAEMLAAAIAGAYLRIPVAHIHGGDVSSTVDEFSRHAITKLSHLHFPATIKSARRILKMGEDRWRVHIVGAPGLDNILNEKLYSRQEIAKRYELDLSRVTLLVVQHPVTDEIQESGRQISETMEALRELGFQAILIYPNADPGSREILRVINKYSVLPFIQIHKTIPRKDYLSLMNVANVIVGNSSSAIIEAPSFRLAAVNIGTRQQGREKAGNIIETGYRKKEIKIAIKKAIDDKNFKKTVQNCKSPYGGGRTGERIAKLLDSVKINSRLLQKRISY